MTRVRGTAPNSPGCFDRAALARARDGLGVNRPGSDTGADNSPSARRVGAPPGLRRALGSSPSPAYQAKTDPLHNKRAFV